MLNKRASHPLLSLLSSLVLTIGFGVLISLNLSACGPSGPSIVTSPENTFNDRQVRLRWFPSKKARGYRLTLHSHNEELLKEVETVPLGCTHEGVEGFTSGLCIYDMVLPPDSNIYRLTLSAVNEHGESVGTVVRITP